MHTSDAYKKELQAQIDKTHETNSRNEQIKTTVDTEIRKALRRLEERVEAIEAKLNITS